MPCRHSPEYVEPSLDLCSWCPSICTSIPPPCSSRPAPGEAQAGNLCCLNLTDGFNFQRETLIPFLLGQLEVAGEAAKATMRVEVYGDLETNSAYGPPPDSLPTGARKAAGQSHLIAVSALHVPMQHAALYHASLLRCLESVMFSAEVTDMLSECTAHGAGILECGPGTQRLAWVARVAAQRFGAGGAWCADGESKVGRPKEFIPGRIFLHDSGQEIDPDSVLVSVAGSEGVDTTRYEREEETADSFVDLRLRIQLLCSPSTGLPSLAAAGSQDAVVGPKHCDLAVKYKLLPPAEDGGVGLTAVMTPAPSLPTCHGYNWEEVRREIDFSDLPHGGDDLIVAATYNVLYNAFATLVDVFLFYAHEHQQVLDLSAQQRVRKKVVEEELEVAHKEKIITHLGFAKFARACGLTGPGCSLFEVQRVSVNPEQMLPEKPPEGQLEGIPVDKFALRLFSFEYRLCAFLEALVRIAYFKHFSLGALCDRLNRLVHTQILCRAGGEDERGKDLMYGVLEKPYPCLAKYKPQLQKWYFKFLDPEKPAGARSVNLSEFVKALKQSDQLGATLTPAAVAEAWMRALSFDVALSDVDETDTELEVTLTELQQVFMRCALVHKEVRLHELTWGTGTQTSGEFTVDRAVDSFMKAFFKRHDKA